LVFAAFFALLAALGLWHRTTRWPIWLASACVALAAPRVLTPFNWDWVWTKLGFLLHRIVSPVFLAVLFCGCIAPIGFLMRLSGKDPLRLKYEPDAESYGIMRTPPDPAPPTADELGVIILDVNSFVRGEIARRVAIGERLLQCLAEGYRPVARMQRRAT
jgi:hypothetical protein